MWPRVWVALLFHDGDTRRGWVVNSTSPSHFTPGKEPVPILQEAGWAPGPVWTGGKSRPHRDSIPDRPARSQSLYRLSYPAHEYNLVTSLIMTSIHTQNTAFCGCTLIGVHTSGVPRRAIRVLCIRDWSQHQHCYQLELEHRSKLFATLCSIRKQG